MVFSKGQVEFIILFAVLVLVIVIIVSALK